MGEVLRGVRVAVTRGRARGEELVAGLEAAGAEVLWVPLLKVAPPSDPGPLEGAARELRWYDWVVFTSVTGVESFVAALKRVGTPVSELEGLRVACIGPATAGAIERHGVRPALVPEAAVAESLLAALLESGSGSECGVGVAGKRYLLPVAAGARRVIEEGLAASGGVVDRVEAYRTVADEEGVAGLVGALRAGSIDVVTFTSPSTVEFFAEGAGGEATELLEGVVVAVIGPVTAAAAGRLGIGVDIEAQEYTASGLLSALTGHYTRSP